MAATQNGINATNFQKSAEKLGSGYRINSAADDAAQLSISEKMRTQVRGLKKAVNNAEEGANYIQVADGAMNEIHSMIHRMRELAIQSLNDTNTPEDRAAMAMEMDKLQAEIDRIDTDSYFNTMPVFQEHEPSYYQIEGNRVWASNQQHSVQAPGNSLNIHLPAGEYNPDSYTVTVPEGIYTTQELIDELDDAFGAMNPANPGFVLEYTQDGRCCLNFEGEDGQPTNIDSVDGGLAYLIYDCFNGASSTSLLGTTVFQGNWPLPITTGQNDELEFDIEKVGGSSSDSEHVTIKIPAGEYSRAEMIELLNKELAAYPGVEAKEYGGNCIQITGGFDKNITGLKGNMFKLELNGEHIYTSVFYDNIRYGTSIGTPASIEGKTYYHTKYTDKIHIDQSNNQLKFDYNGNTIVVPIPAGDYIIDDVSNTSNNNLTYVLNEALKQIPGADINVMARETGIDYSNGTNVRYKYLAMTSQSTGRDLQMKFDTSPGVYENTFQSLFEITNYGFVKDPVYFSGSKSMQITGHANLSGQITIPNGTNTLSLSINNNPAFTITIPPKTYDSLDKLVEELNGLLSEEQQKQIEFVASNNQLIIKGLTDQVTDMGFGNKGGVYTQLFVGKTESVNPMQLTAKGEEHYQQGATAPDINNMASVTMNTDIPKDSTTIDNSNNSLAFYLNGSYISVTLSNGTYSRQGLIEELNKKFAAGGHAVKAELNGNRLMLTTTLTGISQKLSLDVNTRNGNGWKAFVGTYPTTVGPSMPTNYKSYLQGRNDFKNITLDTTNNTFEFVANGKKYSVTLAAKAYSVSELADDLQVLVDSQIGAGNIKISHNGTGLRMEALTAAGNFENPAAQNSGFYNAVFKKEVSGQHEDLPVFQIGTHSYDEAFIIGRYDITAGQVEIVKGMNDKFILDLNYVSQPSDPMKDFEKPLEVTLPAGSYTGKEIADLLTAGLNEQLKANNLSGFTLTATVGGHNTGVAGAIDDRALQITLTEEEITNPDGSKTIVDSPPGSYVLDGVRGSAASSVFYKTSGKPEPSYVTGVQDISNGVIFPPGKNTLTFKTDGVEHSYTFPKEFYNANELIDFLNDKFENGDDNGQSAPLVASMEGGRLKITHKLIGSHTISEVSGSAKGVVFYRENGRKGQDAFMLQVGAMGHQGLELPRLRVGTAALKINSITISRPKYAQKALDRLDTALDLLSSKRSIYGALFNRIEYLNANNRNIAQNTQASESKMRDADMAAEMVEHLKNKLMTEVTDSVLAQANQLPNRLMNLLLK